MVHRKYGRDQMTWYKDENDEIGTATTRRTTRMVIVEEVRSPSSDEGASHGRDK
uniref:Uncharacterized protein n=1 Tax=Hyaloperonospora arabidopsidis (strain Emoy2) TaxID=559515 RepID=M4BU46_HYAAE